MFDMPRLSNYSSIPETHRWFPFEQRRLLGIAMWASARHHEANLTFVAAIRDCAEFPSTWSTYHRFLHESRGEHGLPEDETVTVPQTMFFSPFSMYRFFNRCQVATAVSQGGWSCFEPPCPLVLAKWIRAVGGTFCDVGANSGYYSLLALAAGCAKVIAYEPFAPAADVLRSNLELNGWSDRCEIRQEAASDHFGPTRFYLPMQSHGLLETSVSRDPAFRSQHSIEFDGTAVKLDAMLNENRISGALTIKVDVEGVGPTVAVLNGASELVAKLRPLLMIEYFEGPAEELNAMLAKWSYTSWVFRPDGTGFAENAISPQPDQLNHFLVPTESMQKFLRIVCA